MTIAPAVSRGAEARRRLPRRALASLHLAADRDPVGILQHQHTTRLQELVPVRVGRMLESPFAFFRGSAAVMAADLSAGPTTGLEVVACGDAHISNFGFYASPERELVFDLNDFDEGGIAPWEWDVRRLVASIYIAARANGYSEAACRAASREAARSYQSTLRAFCTRSARDRYFARVDTSQAAAHFGATGRNAVAKASAKARRRTSEQVLRKLTTRTDDGAVRIIDQPPLVQHVDHATFDEIEDLLAQYRSTVREDVAYLLSQYRLVDFVLRVVGVGSVGTRCYLLALQGPTGDVLFLQAKEARPTVLSTHGGRPAAVPGGGADAHPTEGQRVVAAQRILQASSDPFLGWITGWAGESTDRHRVDYYWRQFRDMKGSVEPRDLSRKEFVAYGSLCASVLARAHGQSPNADAIAAYLGRGDKAVDALAEWGGAYADLAESDFAALQDAVRTGRVPAPAGE
ncbi:DUF2252 domain-containing protein [Promicromonospora thailandica]|uniref:Uncharacterized conserved protein, DUF2252 family n=1 Tax=Promicromonospora thailandica TaxID=765201 RepID=A0A9X2JWC6_9MICO|nr:DUF2252 domain-containing protein [Promicromonospora thailandica]MCP2264993.1 Uncharacterized conserved protein, DUF2252 family [Promicromonospora thailandica]BFF18722.1 DUF2252 domain-containing protein [Promicromonospora thailandica]